MAVQVGIGCVFHWKEYEFEDGERANKYFVILGAKTGSNYLAVIATSQPKKRSFKAGCHGQEGYFHIPGKKDWFPRDTWLLIHRLVELVPAAFLSCAMKKEITLEGQLRIELANAIRNCLKQCPDVSQLHLGLL